MSDFDRNYAAARGVGTDRAIAIDQGLRAHMIRVYNYMTGGLALTGIVAWLAYLAAGGDAISVSGNSISGLTPFGQAIFSGPLMWVLLLVPLGLRSEEHTSELQSLAYLVCRLLLEKKKKK